MNVIAILFLLILTTNSSLCEPRCAVTPQGGQEACATIGDWKNDLSCRIKAYMGDTDVREQDGVYVQSFKNAARQLYNELSVILSVNWVYRDPFVPIKRLSKIELIVHRIGRSLYGINWILSKSGCGLNGQRFARLCGDRGGDLPATSCSSAGSI
ncbi:hypothetical protein HDE_07840 [Halotydeus destructor]|nr:hypothetical protein HDE_07840 [Halotydeus destructor]